ncbi:Lipoxygenase domain-containing protein 1 [Fasciolopsis buskii]|uniref:Lipoxygenase domain-containing protein 1 n=1 Tax=Fasciolopsis buskii TaxID=27845 RepID=A0A8E0VNY7_9TREM|nr:Lipoxygenase domain-containing protein 1 [Fasciolopsis buski]
MLIFYQLEKSTKRYKVSVYTGGKLGGGTDANVYIQIFGESAGHDSGLQPLRKDGRNLFERNKCDEFQIESYDLGVVRRVLVFQDNSGTSPSWYLDRILITDLASNDVYNFPCEQWLSKSKSDKRLWKELYATP